MSFEMLLGNEQLKENLARSIRRGHISHFYLISGPKGSGKHTLAKLLAAAILCRDETPPCMHCSPCRRVMSGLHPDFITVDDPDKATVTVGLIRDARADMFIQPNESDYKIYLFPRAQDMQDAGQNALLKILEEPPAYGVYILLTDNPGKLLPTVRSRCTELKLLALPEDILRRRLQQTFPNRQSEEILAAMEHSGGFLGQALELLDDSYEVPPQTAAFVNALCTRSSLELMNVLVPLEKWKRDALGELLNSWLTLVESALIRRSGGKVLSPLAVRLADSRSSEELREAALHLKKAAEYIPCNVSPAAICGYLEWALR